MDKAEEKINLKKLVSSLLREQENGGVKSCFTEVVSHAKVGKTQTVSHCYVLNLDGNQQPKVRELVEYLCVEMTRYCIPRKELEEAIKKDKEAGAQSMTNIARLYFKARDLLVTTENTGEVGELLLYLLIEDILGIPQLICKMPNKTNSNVHNHGSDGIHVSVDTDKNGKETLALYWGEAKLKSRIADAIADAVDVLKEFLLSRSTGSKTEQRDLELIRDQLNVVDSKLEAALISYFDKGGKDYGNARYKGVALVGFDYDKYPKPNSGLEMEALKKTTEENVVKWMESIHGQISKHVNLDTFEIHVFLIPFPSVADFRKAFLDELGIAKNLV